MNAIQTDSILGYRYYNFAEKVSDDEIDNWEHTNDETINNKLEKQSRYPFIEKRDYMGRFRYSMFPKEFLTN